MSECSKCHPFTPWNYYATGGEFCKDFVACGSLDMERCGEVEFDFIINPLDAPHVLPYGGANFGNMIGSVRL